jgi:hypothetical protein
MESGESLQIQRPSGGRFTASDRFGQTNEEMGTGRLLLEAPDLQSVTKRSCSSSLNDRGSNFGSSPAVLEPREVEHVVDERAQHGPALDHRVHHAPLLLRQLRLVQQRRQRNHRVHRRAHLVVHHLRGGDDRCLQTALKSHHWLL